MERLTDINLPTEVLDNASQNGLMIRMKSFKEALEEKHDMTIRDVNVVASFYSDHVSIIVRFEHNYNISVSPEIRSVFAENVSLNFIPKSYEYIDEEEGLYEMVFEIPVVKQKLSIDF